MGCGWSRADHMAAESEQQSADQAKACSRLQSAGRIRQGGALPRPQTRSPQPAHLPEHYSSMNRSTLLDRRLPARTTGHLEYPHARRGLSLLLFLCTRALRQRHTAAPYRTVIFHAPSDDGEPPAPSSRLSPSSLLTCLASLAPASIQT